MQRNSGRGLATLCRWGVQETLVTRCRHFGSRWASSERARFDFAGSIWAFIRKKKIGIETFSATNGQAQRHSRTDSALAIKESLFISQRVPSDLLHLQREHSWMTSEPPSRIAVRLPSLHSRNHHSSGTIHKPAKLLHAPIAFGRLWPCCHHAAASSAHTESTVSMVMPRAANLPCLHRAGQQNARRQAHLLKVSCSLPHADDTAAILSCMTS